jgi:hypothetical protein
MKKNKVLFLTQSALLLALLLTVQLLTRSYGQIVTGSLVNLILLTATFIVGWDGGLIVGMVSPFTAYIMGVGPAFIQIVVFIAIGNCLFVTVAWLLSQRTISNPKKIFVSGISLLVAAVVKMIFLWIGLVELALPLIPGLSSKQIDIISASFTWPQLITASLGGMWALLVVPALQRLTKKSN